LYHIKTALMLWRFTFGFTIVAISLDPGHQSAPLEEGPASGFPEESMRHIGHHRFIRSDFLIRFAPIPGSVAIPHAVVEGGTS
jgi:hypothetical protein